MKKRCSVDKTFDLLDVQRRAIESLNLDRNGQPTGWRVLAQSALINRHEAESDFYRALERRDRACLKVELPHTKGRIEQLRAGERRLASRGVPVLRVALSDAKWRFSATGNRLLTSFATAMGVLSAERASIRRKILSRVSSAAEKKRYEKRPLYIPIELDVTVRKRTIVRLPIDVVASPKALENPRVAYSRSREEWLLALGALPADEATIRFSTACPVARLSRVVDAAPSGKRKGDSRWVLTPSGSSADALLRYISEAAALGYFVKCSLKPSRGAGSRQKHTGLTIERAVPRFEGELHGIYFSSRQKIDSRSLVTRSRRLGSPLLHKFRALSERYWTDQVTHFVAPIENEPIRRLAYAVPEKNLQSVIEDIAKGGLTADLPLIEAKTSIYRFYLDVDLPWDLYGSSAPLAEFKRAQHSFFAGDRRADFGDLSRLIGCMYPSALGTKPIARVSSRSAADEGKEGHHIVFPGVLLPNDGWHGLIVAGILEATAAKAMAREHRHTLIHFLLQMLLDDRQHLGFSIHPLTFHLRSAVFSAVQSIRNPSQLAELLSRNLVLNLRDQRVCLSDADKSVLAQFALDSMGAQAFDAHFERISAAPTGRARVLAVTRLARRCRWEVLRRARYFDHSVYAPTMGIRLLGTSKAGDPSSRYLPADRSSPTAALIIQHSIRASRARPSSPSLAHASVLDACHLKPKQIPFMPRSVEGLFTRARVQEAVTVSDLIAEFSIRPKLGRGARKSVEVVLAPGQFKDTRQRRDRTLKLALSPAPNGETQKPVGLERYLVSFQRYHNRKVGHLILVPPPRRRRRGPLQDRIVKYRNALSGNDTVRVRVWIPSPIVDFAYYDFGGDSRGPLYAGGTSRLDLDVMIDPTTGLYSYTAAWGKTTEYARTDTVPVPNEPAWWRDKVPGAQPIARAQLQVTPQNVSVSAQKGSQGTTVTITYAGIDLLAPTPALLTPGIDGRFTLTFGTDGSLALSAAHDGFPAHSLYVNGSLVYLYDPTWSNAGPDALFPPNDDVQRQLKFPAVPPRRRGGEAPSGIGSTDAGTLPEPTTGPGASSSSETGPGASGSSETGPGASGSSETGPGASSSSETGPGASGSEAGTASGESVTLPMNIVQNADGTVTASFGDSTPETLTFDSEKGGWTGDGGSFLSGTADSFNDTNDWTVTISTDENGDPSIGMDHGDDHWDVGWQGSEQDAADFSQEQDQGTWQDQGVDQTDGESDGATGEEEVGEAGGSGTQN